MVSHRVVPLAAQVPTGKLDLLAKAEPGTIGHFRHAGFMDPAIRAVVPGGRVAGTAVTVRVPGAEGSVLPLALKYVRPGDILVVDRCGDARHACYGGLVGYAASKVGVAAVIVDGMVTDIDELRAYGVPVWARGLSAITGKPMGIGGTIGEPVACGGVTVRCGDAILADENGIFVVDPAEIEDVSFRAVAMQLAEEKTRVRLDDGLPLHDLLQRLAGQDDAPAAARPSAPALPTSSAYRVNTMISKHNPAGFAEPAAYSHAVAVPASARTLYVAGQIAVDREGNSPAGFAEQAELVFANVKAALDAAGMTLADVVKMNTYLTRPSDYAEFVRIRSAAMGGNKPTSTLVYVSALAKPELLVEIEAIAAVG